MTDRIPTTVVSGRRVAMGLLVVAMVATVLLVVWTVALLVTAPAVV